MAIFALVAILPWERRKVDVEDGGSETENINF